MLGFKFRDIHSSTYGVYWQSIDRSLLPAKRVIRYQVPGRDGYYGAGEAAKFDNRRISGTLAFFGQERTLAALRTRARLIALWLSGSGELIFDDEPDKAYTAEIISEVPVELLVRAGSCGVTFDCQPFAVALDYTEQKTASADLPHTEEVTTAGTWETPCIIEIKALTAITGDLTITRKVNI